MHRKSPSPGRERRGEEGCRHWAPGITWLIILRGNGLWAGPYLDSALWLPVSFLKSWFPTIWVHETTDNSSVDSWSPTCARLHKHKKSHHGRRYGPGDFFPISQLSSLQTQISVFNDLWVVRRRRSSLGIKAESSKSAAGGNIQSLHWLNCCTTSIHTASTWFVWYKCI